jgi:P-loop containing dynein motor region D4
LRSTEACIPYYRSLLSFLQLLLSLPTACTQTLTSQLLLLSLLLLLLVAEQKVYEPGGTLDSIRKRVTFFMDKMNEEFPAKKLELVLFADALKHLLRLNRLLEMPRGSALLVGVGGSGKQSLTTLASYISRANCFQVKL